MNSFFTPIKNLDSVYGINWGSLGDFAERYCAWGNRSFEIIKIHRNKEGQIVNFEIQERNSAPHLSLAWRISKLTLIIPLVVLGIKAAFRWNYNVTVIPTDKDKKPLQLNEQLPLAEKIKQLHQYHFEAPLSDSDEAKAISDIDTLCELARANVDHLFKNKLQDNCTRINDKDNMEFLTKINSRPEETYRAFLIKLELALPKILKLVEKKTQELLIKDEKDIKLNNTQYKKLNKQLRYIFLNLLKHEKKLTKIKENYAIHLQKSLGNREFCNIDGSQPCYYFSEAWDILGYHTYKELQYLANYFQIYRRHYCLRVSDQKAEDLLKETGQYLKDENLLKLTWLHGTRALKTTNGVFIPTGWLRQVGIVPFTGELKFGSGESGINQNELSGTFLDNSSCAQDYSNSFSFSLTVELKSLNEIYELNLNSIYNLGITSYKISGIVSAIDKIFAWDHDTFTKDHKQKLFDKIKALKNELRGLEAYTPVELYNWHDDCYTSQHREVKAALSHIEQLLNKKGSTALSELQKEDILNSFPSVVGSYTLLSHPFSFDDRSGEYTVHGAAELGKDLQVIFVKKEDAAKAKDFLTAKGLSDKVKIYSFEQLEHATALNKVISPHLADIFSSKKMANL